METISSSERESKGKHFSKRASRDNVSSGHVPRQYRHRVMLYFVAAGAAALGVVADFMIGYVKPGALGLFGVAQVGWAQLPLWRPVVSMLLLSIIFPVYILAFFTLSREIEQQSPMMGRAVRTTILISCPGWMLIHGLFSLPQYIYAYLYRAGYESLASEVSDLILTITVPSLIVSFGFMVLALVVLFVAVIRKQTKYPKWFAFLSPLTVACITLPLMQIFRDSAVVLAIAMGTMHLGMLLFFLAVALAAYNRYNV